jgi:hypothetical protein
MRMWLTNPKEMCRQHLLGEHVEMHMFVGTIRKGMSVEGYVSGGLFEVDKILERHDELVIEMSRRGFHHGSPITQEQEEMILEWMKKNKNYGKVDSAKNRLELANRCEECKKLQKLGDTPRTAKSAPQQADITTLLGR